MTMQHRRTPNLKPSGKITVILNAETGTTTDYYYFEAQHDLYLLVRSDHIKCAIPGSTTNCAIALAGHEQAGVVGVHVHRTIAYLVFAAHEGPYRYKEEYAIRYTMSHAMERQIARFDDLGIFEPGGYLFSRVTPGRTLDAGKKRDTKRHETGKPKRQIAKRATHKIRQAIQHIAACRQSSL